MAEPRWSVALVVLSLTLAGCLGGDDASDREAQPQDDASEETSGHALALPTWTVGQYWTYSTDFLGELTYVVTQDRGQDWFIETDHPDLAFFDTRSDVSFLGPVRKSDLAGSQGTDRVRYFDWPLTEGKTWTTRWDGEEQTVTVLSVGPDSAEVEARAGGVLRSSYVYDNAVGWFESITFYDANGTANGGRLVEAGQPFTGEVVRWQLTSAGAGAGTIGAQPQSWVEEFTVPEGTTDVWIGFRATCPAGQLAFGIGPEGELFGLHPQAEQAWGVNEPCPLVVEHADVVATAPGSGTWRYGMAADSPQGEGTYEYEILLRTMERRPVDI